MMFYSLAIFCAMMVLPTHGRKSADGPCTDIVDKSECCRSYDSRLSMTAASNCVPATDKFSNGFSCEAEFAIVQRQECALVGACYDHVDVASAACLAGVIGKISVTAEM